jgi:hypothetical protein
MFQQQGEKRSKASSKRLQDSLILLLVPHVVLQAESVTNHNICFQTQLLQK